MVSYIGSGPYCYSNSLAMLIGSDAPPVGLIETLAGAPFGVELYRGPGSTPGGMPFFSPIGWDPEIGLDAAIELLGRTCARTTGGTPDEALDRLRAAVSRGPVLVGPVDMGLLRYHPNSGNVGGADHYVIALEVGDDWVLLHDPQGNPYATLPITDFLESWRADRISYTNTPYIMRSEFSVNRKVEPLAALKDSLPYAARWLTGAAQQAEQFAELADAGLPDPARGLLSWFSVGLGARRLNDASTHLRAVGRTEAADIAAEQSRIIGGLQYPVANKDDAAFATGMRRLAPGYDQLRRALQ